VRGRDRDANMSSWRVPPLLTLLLSFLGFVIGLWVPMPPMPPYVLPVFLALGMLAVMVCALIANIVARCRSRS